MKKPTRIEKLRQYLLTEYKGSPEKLFALGEFLQVIALYLQASKAKKKRK